MITNKKGYTLECTEDGTLNIKCDIYRIANLRKEISEIHNQNIVAMAKQQLKEKEKLNMNEIARKFNIAVSSVAKVLKDRGYKRTVIICELPS